MLNKEFKRNEIKPIKEPYINGYCEKCINNDGDIDNLCCKKIGLFVNCGAVFECFMYKENEDD